MLCRRPAGPLARIVERIWASDGDEAPPPASGRERSLPTGTVHLCLRLGPAPLRLYHGVDDPVGWTVAGGVIAGAGTRPWLKDVSHPVPTVGAVLRPGGAAALAGVPAAHLAGAHTPLDALWGGGYVETLRDRLATAGSAARRIAVFEAALTARLDPDAGVDPLIAAAAARLGRAGGVAAVAAACGLGHRHFARRFHAAVGLAPARYGRVVRFTRALARLHGDGAAGLADIAAAAGYADQAHFSRDFAAFAGITPGRYRSASPLFAHHVPVAPADARHVRSVQDAGADRW
ncbi:helix-turn-helix domain-containing protein [Azospirillum halopraeferens]|uniref:helix-turn-helix domain-containing protein n=1 Tax=Azospirillum halopraeferens TaxID=34010 RepID=UPI000683DBF0|nr:helix-turn-helix domain-containing protein [Azospirillum halopraeferens]